MRKAFLFLLATVLLVFLAGCSIETGNPEKPLPEGTDEESPVENIEQKEPLQENPPISEIPEEKTETDYEWKAFVEKMAISSITEKELGKLLEWGFSREEIMEMAPAEINLKLQTMELGVEKEKLLVSGGSSGTTGLEFVEEFILSVEKNEAASVCGTMNGDTFQFYFELSFEPDGLIKLIQIPPHSALSVRSGELSEIYDTEAFYCFLDGEGNYFSIPKIKFHTDERFPCEPGEDISGAAVTAKEAEKEAKNALLLSEVSRPDFSYENSKSCFWGTHISINNSGDPEKAGEYFKNLVPRVTGHAVLEGENYYMVSMFEDETNIGYGYAVSANKPFKIFSISEVDGSFRPIAYNVDPRVVLPHK